MTTLKKPTPKARKALYDYTEVTEYLERLHGKQFNDYSDHFGGKSDEYQNWWHWILDCNSDLSNGSEIYLPNISYLKDKKAPAWRKEILKFYYDYLGHDFEDPMWVEW